MSKTKYDRIRVITRRTGEFNESYEHRVYFGWIFGKGLEFLCPVECISRELADSPIGEAIIKNIRYLRHNPFEDSNTRRLKLEKAIE